VFLIFLLLPCRVLENIGLKNFAISSNSCSRLGVCFLHYFVNFKQVLSAEDGRPT